MGISGADSSSDDSYEDTVASGEDSVDVVSSGQSPSECGSAEGTEMSFAVEYSMEASSTSATSCVEASAAYECYSAGLYADEGSA